MKRKMNKKGKIFVSLLFVLVILGFIYINSKINMKEINIVEKNKNYTLKISYPHFKNKKLDKSIKDYVDGIKGEFINTVNESKKDYSDIEYDLNIGYTYNEYKDIKYIHLTSYSFTGGNHYAREDKTINYSNSLDKEIDLSYYFNDTNYLNIVSRLSKIYVIKYFKENNKTYENEWIDEGVSNKVENYHNFEFTDEGLSITFVPYQVSSWSDGEIKITIPYKDINKYLKEPGSITEIVSGNEISPDKRDLSKYKDKKLIALTFDDGPGYSTTNKLLDELKQYDAKVTFFVLGSRVSQFQEVVKRAYKEGHQIGSHTFNHLNLKTLDEKGIIDEIVNTDMIIKEIIGDMPSVLRPPYGNIDEIVRRTSEHPLVLWNIDTEDWKTKNSDKIANNIVKNAKDGSIVLMHDIYKTSVEGAIKAINILEKEGYAFVTIEEMAEIKNITLNNGESYFGM